ncbi:MAG: hypothetical protein AAB897_01935 [Patescibacteria group bacterium]
MIFSRKGFIALPILIFLAALAVGVVGYFGGREIVAKKAATLRASQGASLQDFSPLGEFSINENGLSKCYEEEINFYGSLRSEDNFEPGRVTLIFHEIAALGSPDSIERANIFLEKIGLGQYIPPVKVLSAHLYPEYRSFLRSDGTFSAAEIKAFIDELGQKIESLYPQVKSAKKSYFGKESLEIVFDNPVDASSALDTIMKVEDRFPEGVDQYYKAYLNYERDENFLPVTGMFVLNVPRGREIEYVCKIKNLEKNDVLVTPFLNEYITFDV